MNSKYYFYLTTLLSIRLVQLGYGQTVMTVMKSITIQNLTSSIIDTNIVDGEILLFDSANFYAIDIIMDDFVSLFNSSSSSLPYTVNSPLGCNSSKMVIAHRNDSVWNSDYYINCGNSILLRDFRNHSFVQKVYPDDTNFYKNSSLQLIAGNCYYHAWFESNPLRMVIRYNYDNLFIKSNFTIPSNPTNLVCESYTGCIATSPGFIHHYSFNYWPSNDRIDLYLSKTNDIFIRKHGIMDTKLYKIYFCRDTDDGFIIEAWEMYGYNVNDFLYSKEFTLAGSCKSMGYDYELGIVFVLTPKFLLAMDHQFDGLSKVTFDGIENVVSLNNIFNTGYRQKIDNTYSTANFNYLSITQSFGGSTSLRLIQYTSHYDQCKNGVYHDRCQNTTSILLNDTLYISLHGYFEKNSSMLSIEMGGIKHLIINYNSSLIQFVKTIFTPPRILFSINKIKYDFIVDNLYPMIIIGESVQQDGYIFIHGNKMASWYQYIPTIGNKTIPTNFINSTTIKLSPESTIDPNSFITLKINYQQELIDLSLSPFVKQTNPSTLSDKGQVITISGSFFGSAIVYLDVSELKSKLNSDNDIVVELPNGIYSSIIIGNGVKNTTLSLKYSNLSIDYVSHSSVDTLTIYASNFGIISNDVEIQLADEVLVISSFNASIGQIKVKLTSNSIKGNLVIKYKTQSISIGVNLKPHINSINPTTPSSDGDTITVTGSYLQSSIIELTNNNIVTTLTCTTLSTTSQSCNIIKGTGIFTITSTSSSPRIYQDPLISNPYSSIYKSSSSFSRVDSLVSNSYECTYKSNSISPSPEPSSSPSTCPTLIPSSSPTPSPSPSPSPSSSSLPTSSPSPEQSSTPSSSLTLLASSSPSSSPSPSSSVGEPSFSSESSPLELSTIESISNEASYKTLSELGSIKTEIIQESLAQSNQPSIYHLLLLFLFILL